MRLLCLAFVLLVPVAAHADPTLKYPWLDHPVAQTLEQRIAPPAGAQRTAPLPHSFGSWLRTLPLLPSDTAVHLFDGTLKARQDVHAAVVDLDVGKRDLQQCADAVMRLRAEYQFAADEFAKIAFHPDAGKPRAITWSGGAHREGWQKYLTRVFADAGSASLQAEMKRATGRVQPGDVLIQGGFPGHAVLVLDAADAPDGERYLLIGQSYMPAQQFHVVKNLDDAKLSPWFRERDLDSATGLHTPEWLPFHRADVRRF